ncbi:hypothetical protein PIB30_029273 [Stylosanthes scabra]|uniref:Uncharacterized protein n=1 Tax=Stylosanthes scabra TaxID=79078 RepID=A0ABU6V9B3_9FABA|nr:hypothetical protein [Stylosanthes scabra]
MAKGKAKLCQPPTQASPKLAALGSNIAVQIPTPTPDVPAKETVMSTLPPKKRQSFRMAGESSSRRDTKTTCRRSCKLAALNSVTKPVSEEKVEEDTNLEQDEAVPVAEGGGREDLPKNDVYDALWAMLDAESEAEEILGEWDLDSVLQNWGRNEPDVGPAGQRITLSTCTEDRAIFKCGEAKFGAEVAESSERNERIATKPRRLLLDQMRTQHMEHAYASRRGRHAQKVVSAQMRTHKKLACVPISGFQHL